MAPGASNSKGAPSADVAVQLALFCAAAAAGTVLSRRATAARSDEKLVGPSSPEIETTPSSANDDDGGLEVTPIADRSLPTTIVTAGTDGDDGEDDEGGFQSPALSHRPLRSAGTVTVAYSSTTGTCSDLASSMAKILRSRLASTNGAAGVTVQIVKVDDLDWWDEILNPPDEVEDDDDDDDEEEQEEKKEVEKKTPISAAALSAPPAVILVLPTWTGGTLPLDAACPEDQPGLLSVLEDVANDWRVAPNPLRPSSPQLLSEGEGDANLGLQVAVFGVGSSAYDPDTFCVPAKRANELLVGKLGARPIGRDGGPKKIGTGDVEAQDVAVVFENWGRGIAGRIGAGIAKLHKKNKEQQKKTGGNKSESIGCCQGEEKESSCACIEEEKEFVDPGTCGTGTCNDPAGDDDNEEEYYSAESSDEESAGEPDVIDLEDMGEAMKDQMGDPSKGSSSSNEPKEMVTPRQAVQLKKEGYKLVGTHSAVKLCRWTKHQLRGRGGCYKHTFYGITSYLCMEATPSLACANKCVFCWRHHKNPVGREWRWKTDDPHMIVAGAIEEHVKMIKEARGIPGVQKERWEEAHTVRHCALSLVGEPIMYPRIDEFLGDLHSRNISTFLVTNGQHPAAIGSLRPVTQLYVSVDAPNKTSLIEIDRPLFADAWERLRTSLTSLKDKGQRTVARLTVVKGWNSDDIGGYAELVALGRVSLVEVKGVTFCGKSDASNLTMSNTPWHHEVVALTEKLRDELARMRADQLSGGEKVAEEDLIPEYGLACEHRHSVSVLLARVDQFAGDIDPTTGRQAWNTWIDYEKFSALAAKHAEDSTFTFGVRDYTAPAPAWALFGAEEEGFDPTDTRHRRKGKSPLYTKFDGEGVPTHDAGGEEVDAKERARLKGLMEKKRREIGGGDEASVVTESRGMKTVEDASLMFRGLVVGQG